MNRLIYISDKGEIVVPPISDEVRAEYLSENKLYEDFSSMASTWPDASTLDIPPIDTTEPEA